MELRNAGLDLVPQPHADMFAGWVLQPRNVVHELVVQPVDHRTHTFFQVAEIHYPAQFRVKRPLQEDGQVIGMSMNFLAFVAIRHMRQEVCGIECELFKYDHSTGMLWSKRARALLRGKGISLIAGMQCGA